MMREAFLQNSPNIISNGTSFTENALAKYLTWTLTQSWEHIIAKSYFLVTWSSYVPTSFAILCSLLDVQTSFAYLNLLRNVQDMLGPYMGLSEGANLRNTTAGQPCRSVVSLGDPMKLTMHLWQWKQAQSKDCPPKHCHVLSREIVALVIDKLYRENFEQFLFA